MLFTRGTRLGSYEIEAHIGSGGMGDVYRARDTRLGRSVAIKVLAGTAASDPDWLARFEQEARLLASLHHPHIAQIYGFEEDGGRTPALVMELVEGQSLADRLASGPLLLPEALLIALQIAEALEAAHERGIIHRDLKPANVLLTPGWVAKVLDFGLAKVLDPVTPPERGPARLNSPAVTSPVTVSGVILGTAAYMAPEQARGQAVDKRTDLWPFGVVLYEMITGRRPFDGETISDTIAAVLRQDVDWKRLPAQTPYDVRRLLKRCLERNPKNRLHDAADARLAILDARDESEAGAPVRGAAAAPRTLPWIAASLAAIAIAGAMIGRQLLSTPAPADLPRSVSDLRPSRRRRRPTSRTWRLRLMDASWCTRRRSMATSGCSSAASTSSSRVCSRDPRGAVDRSSRPTVRGSGSSETEGSTRCRPPEATRSPCAACRAVPVLHGVPTAGSCIPGRGCPGFLLFPPTAARRQC